MSDSGVRTRSYDLEGMGVDFAEDNSSLLSTYLNNTNEWIYRDITTGGSDLGPTYDANGNLTDDGKDYTYLYVAWNRLTLISTTGGSPTLVAEYRYNGLGQRIIESDGMDTEHLVYDGRWRLVSRHDGSDYTEEVVHHAAGLDGFGGASDVDSVIMRRTFLTTGSPQTEDGRYYILQNWRQDPAVTITDAGVQVERAHFSPYGRVLGMPAGDTDFDFAFDSDDQATLSGWSGAYQAHADVDLDGDVDADDATSNTTVTMGWDVLSSVGSKIGYAGYVQDAYVPTVSHVRYRVLKVDLGRWLQRDPAGYVDGANLYEYAVSSPVRMVDRMGLASQIAVEGGCATDSGCGGPMLPVPPADIVLRDCQSHTTWKSCKDCCKRLPASRRGSCSEACWDKPGKPIRDLRKDWCTIVPDGGPGFKNCCFDHDMCYLKCWVSQWTCDEKFCECLERACATRWYKEFLHKAQRLACMARAKAYCLGVKAGGFYLFFKSCGWVD